MWTAINVKYEYCDCACIFTLCTQHEIEFICFAYEFNFMLCALFYPILTKFEFCRQIEL